MIHIPGGILIDWGCSGLMRLPEGILIPTQSTTSYGNEELLKDIAELKAKHFPEEATGEAKLNAVHAFGKELQEAMRGARP